MAQAEQEPGETEEAGGGLDIGAALAAVRRRWRLIAVLVVAAGAIAAAVASALPNRYDAAATIQIDARKRAITAVEGVVSELKTDQASLESEVEIIRSKAITLRVIEILNLRADPELAGGAGPTRILRRLGLGGLLGADAPEPASIRALHDEADLLAPASPGRATPERDTLLIAFQERLKVGRVRNTLLIEIKFSSADPVKAARIVNTVAEVYVREQLDAKQRAAGVATGLLERQLDAMRSRLSAAERKVEQFKAANDIFDAEGQVLSEKRMARLMEQTVNARNATAETKAKYEQARAMRERGQSNASIAEVLQSHAVRMLKDEAGKAQRREAELATRYGPMHPEMLKARADAREAEQQLEAEIAKLVENLRHEYAVALDRERQLDTTLDGAKEGQVVAKDAAVTLKELEREALTSRQLFEALLARYKQMTETQGLQLPDARIVERADVPLFPSAPKRKQIVLLAVVGGLVLGLGLALLIEFMAPGIGRPEDVERTLDLQHLTSVPFQAAAHGDAGGAIRSIRLIVADPNGVYAEAIRGLRHEIDARRPRRHPTLIMLASTLPDEGKSQIASNLAHHYALTGARTLLVDADLRRASLTRILMPRGAQSGLMESLERRLPIEPAIQRDHATGLCFLPAHGLPGPMAHASELLGSPRLPILLERLKSHFDLVILDSPPILPVVDARILANHVDQIVFVTAWRRTPKALARRALKSLGANERKIIGAVLNRVDPASMTESLGYARTLQTDRAA